MIGAVPRPWNRAERAQVAIAYAIVVLPALGVPAALALAAVRPVGAADLALFAAMYAATMLGITAGYHRLATHRSFRAAPGVRVALLALGAMAAQGPVLFWAAAHRRHHQHGDRPGDPHTPGEGGLAGFWHAHVGWMLRPQPFGDWPRLVPDLLRDPVAFDVNRYYLPWLAMGLVAPAVAGGLLGGPWGALSGFLWGGPVRIFAVHHATWCVNSVCHLWGRRPYDTGDRSTNHLPTALVTFGEGWHNNHHAFQASARHGLERGQLDLTWLFIRALVAAGLASDPIVPDAAARGKKALEGTLEERALEEAA